MRRVRFAPGLVALLFLQGCALLSPPPPRTGGSTLSDAAREAKRDEDDKHRRLTVNDSAPQNDGMAVEVSIHYPEATQDDPEATQPISEPGASRDRQTMYAGFVAGAGSVGSLEPYGFGGLQLGLSTSDRSRVDLTLLGHWSRFTSASGLRGSFENPYEIALDLSGRFQLLPEHTVFGIYPMVGLRYGALSWDYHNPIVIDYDDGPSSVQSDAMKYYAPYGGIGVSLVRTPLLELGVQFTRGVRFYDGYTNAGLRNDRFRATPFTHVTLETSVRF